MPLRIEGVLAKLMADEPTDDQYGAPIPMPPAMQEEQLRHEAAIDVLLPKLQRARKRMETLDREFEAEMRRWRRTMVATCGHPDAAHANFKIDDPPGYFRLYFEKAPPKPPEWVADYLNDEEDDDGLRCGS